MSRRDTTVFEAMCDRALDDDRDRDAEHFDQETIFEDRADAARKGE